MLQVNSKTFIASLHWEDFYSLKICKLYELLSLSPATLGHTLHSFELRLKAKRTRGNKQSSLLRWSSWSVLAHFRALRWGHFCQWEKWECAEKSWITPNWTMLPCALSWVPDLHYSAWVFIVYMEVDRTFFFNPQHFLIRFLLSPVCLVSFAAGQCSSTANGNKTYCSWQKWAVRLEKHWEKITGHIAH